MGGGPTQLKSESGEERIDSLNVVEASKDGYKLIYARSKVYQHPTEISEENLAGFIGIYQNSHVVPIETRLMWVSQDFVIQSNQMDQFRQVELETIPTIVQLPADWEELTQQEMLNFPLKSIYSILSQAPSPTNHYGSINFYLYTPDVYPTLYYHENLNSNLGEKKELWGGAALLRVLSDYLRIMNSCLEKSLYLINPSKEDLLVHSTILFPDQASLPSQTIAPRGGNEIEYPDQVGPGVENLSFSLLSGFSRLTRSVQTVAQTVLSHPLSKPLLSSLPPPLLQFSNVSAELSRTPITNSIIRLQERAGVESFDSARIYLANWARVVSQDSIRNKRMEREKGGGGGIDEEEEISGNLEDLIERFGLTGTKSSRAIGSPIILSEWKAWFDDSGKLMLSSTEAKKRIFQRGLVNEARSSVWPFLLKVFPWTSTAVEREFMKEAHTIQYAKMKERWSQSEEIMQGETYAEESHRIEIDCLRTDRTHPLFEADNFDPSQIPSSHSTSNPHIKAMQNILLTYTFSSHGIETGMNERNYVQGMSDLLSPLYVVAIGETEVLEDGPEMTNAEAESFWMFCEIMQRNKMNFRRDQAGMSAQLKELEALIKLMDPALYGFLESMNSLNLFFCFRWILCSFKRELSFKATERLWEVLFTDNYGKKFHLFVALAILEEHREVIMKYLRGFDEILKYVNELSQTLYIDSLLCSAEVLYLTFEQVIKASDQQTAMRRRDMELRQRTEASNRRRGDVIELSSTEKETEQEIDEKLRKLLK